MRVLGGREGSAGEALVAIVIISPALPFTHPSGALIVGRPRVVPRWPRSISREVWAAPEESEQLSWKERALEIQRVHFAGELWAGWGGLRVRVLQAKIPSLNPSFQDQELRETRCCREQRPGLGTSQRPQPGPFPRRDGDSQAHTVTWAPSQEPLLLLPLLPHTLSIPPDSAGPRGGRGWEAEVKTPCSSC